MGYAFSLNNLISTFSGVKSLPPIKKDQSIKKMVCNFCGHGSPSPFFLDRHWALSRFKKFLKSFLFHKHTIFSR